MRTLSPAAALVEHEKHLRELSAEERQTHADVIGVVEEAGQALARGDDSRSIELLRRGGRFIADTVRELGLELLVRLILPKG